MQGLNEKSLTLWCTGIRNDKLFLSKIIFEFVLEYNKIYVKNISEHL